LLLLLLTKCPYWAFAFGHGVWSAAEAALVGLREAAEAAAITKDEKRVAKNTRDRERRRKLGAVNTEAELAVDRAQEAVDLATTDNEREAGPSETDHLCCVKGFV